MELDRWGKQNRIAGCIKALQQYGGVAKPLLPQLAQLEADLRYRIPRQKACRQTSNCCAKREHGLKPTPTRQPCAAYPPRPDSAGLTVLVAAESVGRLAILGLECLGKMKPVAEPERLRNDVELQIRNAGA